MSPERALVQWPGPRTAYRQAPPQLRVGAGAQIVLGALATSDNLNRARSHARRLGQVIEHGIAVGRVVVEEDEPAHLGQLPEGDCLADGAVTPANPPCALVIRVLPVVDEEIDACG